MSLILYLELATTGFDMNRGSSTPIEHSAILLRLFRYLVRYRLRLSIGFCLALFVSLSNLLSLGALLPIFEIIGSQQTENAFAIKSKERKILENYLAKKEMPFWQKLQGSTIAVKHRANLELSHYSPKEAIFILCAFIFSVHFLKLLCLSAGIYFLGTIGLASVRDIRMEFYIKLQRLGMQFLNREKTGTIMSRAVNDGELVGRLLSVQFTEVLVDIFYILTHVGFLVWISWKMSLLMLILIPILLIPIDRIAKRVRRVSTGQQKRLADLSAHLQEFIAGIRVIRAFARERTEYRRFSIANQNLYKNTFIGHYYHQLSPVLIEFITTVMILAFFVWGAYEISQGDMSRALFFTFFFVLTFVIRPIKRISITVNTLSTATSAAARIFEVLDKKVKLKEKRNAKELRKFQDCIEYQDVSFAYPDTDTKVLKNISFQIKQGEDAAFVGSSGAGKSTLVDLLLRLYDVQEGAIRIDKNDIRDLSLRSLRSSIGVVSQDVFLFNASISENIAYGRDNIPLEQIEAAARDAQAHDFIKKLPRGYDALIGERGLMLSGGQRQRIAIARTLLLDPAILILDEATSSLDNESEYQVQQALEKLCLGRTVLKIAHRLSTVYKSQRILVLEQGCIVEEGSHQELLAKKGSYYKLYTSQVQR